MDKVGFFSVLPMVLDLTVVIGEATLQDCLKTSDFISSEVMNCNCH